jgi:transposase InsO family protein
MRYAFIYQHRFVWPVCVQCRVLGVSATGYRQHQLRRAKIAQRRHLTDEALLAHIRAVHAETRGVYGWPCLWRELGKRGLRVGKQRVQRLMQKRNCWDNACSETLFGSLNVEWLHGQRFATIREAKDAVLDWLRWYNRSRMHSTLDYSSSAEYEQRWTEQQQQAAA